MSPHSIPGAAVAGENAACSASASGLSGSTPATSAIQPWVTGKKTFDTSATGVTRMARIGPALSALGMNRTTAMPRAVKHAVPSTQRQHAARAACRPGCRRRR